MNRSLAPKLLAFLLLLGAIAGTAAPEGQKQRLVDRYAAGDVHQVENTFSMAMDMVVSLPDGNASTIKFSSRERTSYREDVLAVDAQGPARLRRTYAVSRSADTDADGTKVNVSSLQGKTVTLRRVGQKVTVLARGGKISAEDRKSLTDELRNRPPKLFPDHAVAPGDEWEVDARDLMRSFATEGSLDRAVMKARFQDIVPFGGHQCARVHVTLELSGRPTPQPFEMTSTLSGYVYHALKIQRSVGADLTGPMTIRGHTESDGVQAEMKGDGTMTMKWGDRFLKVAGKPVAAKR